MRSVSIAGLKSSKKDGFILAEQVLRGTAKVTEIKLERDKFKLGSLDSMLIGLERAGKDEALAEAFLRRIEKIYSELVTDKSLISLKLEAKDFGPVSIEKYLTNFDWDDIKFPRTANLAELLRAIEDKIDTMDKGLKNKTSSYQASKGELLSMEKKESAAGLNAREASEIIFELLAKNSPNAKPDLFVNTNYLCSILVILSKERLEEFTQKYERINELIVPNSLTVLGELHERVIVHFLSFIKVFDDIVLRIKEQFGAVAKRLVFSQEDAAASENRKKNVQNQNKVDRDFLVSGCIECFKEVFVALTHLKFIKVVIDSTLRFGAVSSSNYTVVLLVFEKGKDSKVQAQLIKAFAEKDKIDFYGTKEQLNDTEDFFPFVYTTYQINI